MDKEYMKLALELAERGKGRVNPNPLVGAIIVKDNKIIGEGYHKCYGKAHAEVNAFENAIENVEGATMYVTLEPCSHYGKTPPCVERIIKEKISKVVIGSLDPNPLVAGRGVKRLREHGIDVEIGVLEEECKKVNEVFMKYIVSKMPFVVMKWAMSLDGKIATVSGDSKWISGEKSRENVHNLRNELSAIMVGVETVIKDNPMLTCRIENGRNPIRIIVDSKLRIPMDSNIVNSSSNIRTIVATTEEACKAKEEALKSKDIVIIHTQSHEERVDLEELMKILGELGIDSILLEGGGTLNFSALKQGIVDKIQVYIAPKIIGGEKARTPVSGNGFELIRECVKVENLIYKKIDEDVYLEGYIGGRK
ncbi:diaminohydroxyphosphoribosylaminopyrimidine deaminase [Clostridium collagenovorans DSM 3089]|uniref:Riboflavin biosynthesis protein RibD n=1 Tax=Clostridium collagenovorans DSM 3089 TaxID=1121306 RepID=A0A1M5XHA3_9CLOT|nr:bifunctional diaminohydroxyphosphoribosylaminopyrimidine deaminase/5-amino-6-(5-phosphoribosylamino)uracil reductase RibD [Clostridium collagenovorans]SHH99156.1 diaminohydroxyphosphoribosylaminopyrimidine deaminase [Clostridium collagenovorans DSM 3089]